MKTMIKIFVAALLFTLNAASQPVTVTFHFTGDLNGQPVDMDSVWVKNKSLNCDTMLYAPDFTLVVEIMTTGMTDPAVLPGSFVVSQNYPNPFTGKTTFTVMIPESDLTVISIYDLAGRIVTEFNGVLNTGIHSFTVTSGRESCSILTVRYRGESRSLKLLNLESGDNEGICRISHTGVEAGSGNTKSGLMLNPFQFNPGNQLLLVGYKEQEESGLLDKPVASRDYILQFATNVPCQGLDSLFYEGRYYHTVQIYSQCWMKENLEAGVMIPGSQTQTNNGIIEKYCYANSLNNCKNEGGLYLWEEMMQYESLEGGRGICPEGWHVATDEEWKILEGAADSQYGIGSSVWNNLIARGFDAGKNLKSTSGWYSGGNGTDLFGFCAVGAGYWYANGFSERTMEGFYGTSSRYNNAFPFLHGFNCMTDQALRNYIQEVCGVSVRCLKDQ